VHISLASPDQYARIAEVTIAAYEGFAATTESYRKRLADVSSRANDAELWVATDADGEILGSVTRCPVGSPWREIARAGEGEFRMLSVTPAAQGAGVGAALVRHMIDRCRAEGDRALVLSSTPQMTRAHAIYRRFGFARLPERDWEPEPDVQLWAFTLPFTDDDPHTAA